MAQVDAMRKYVKNSGGGTSEQTIEQLLQCEDHSWGMQNSPTFGKNHDHEEHDHHNTKKSVLMKVKEKAKKLRHTLSNKKKHNDNATPAWGVSLEDYYDDDDEGADAEYYGAPMYESAQAPEDVKMTAKQHPREDVVIPENHILPNSPSPRKGHEDKTALKFTEPVEQKKYEPMETINRTSQATSGSIAEKPALPPVTIPDSATENIVTHESFSESNAKSLVEEWTSPRSATEKLEPQETTPTSKTITETVTEKLAPAYAMASEATGIITSKLHGMAIATSAALSPKQSPRSTSNEKTYDKGVSVKEYLMNKFEPGDDEKALSQVISEAISPRKDNNARRGVVEKVRGAISSHLAATKVSSSQVQGNTSSASIPISTTAHERNTSSTSIPISTNAHEEENEGQGRILQSN
ncbi:hypothetical protein ACHQM5_003091 [Ranunculus cassubicifolius]